jgi:transcription elongation factor Elf1
VVHARIPRLDLAVFQSSPLSPDAVPRYFVFTVEHIFMCPYCGEEISMVLDLSVRRQTYVEDCEVCCNPIQVSYTVQDDFIAAFNAKMLN